MQKRHFEAAAACFIASATRYPVPGHPPQQRPAAKYSVRSLSGTSTLLSALSIHVKVGYRTISTQTRDRMAWMSLLELRPARKRSIEDVPNLFEYYELSVSSILDDIKYIKCTSLTSIKQKVLTLPLRPKSVLGLAGTA